MFLPGNASPSQADHGQRVELALLSTPCNALHVTGISAARLSCNRLLAALFSALTRLWATP
ncbi:hypothetical protein [uncultured Desulfovibrio sp.]|uniref:hypothetical protein n=1 Tax=uncultured Desulfovibrio sp. TaxID=167968 RepID=UPI00039B89D4|nr:hypothetical protein [uncultured Desulfovibrio sp.]